METEPVIPPIPKPVVPPIPTPQSEPARVLRQPVVALSATFIAGWLFCLGIVQWRQHSQARSLAAAKTAALDLEPTPVLAPDHPVSEIKPVAEAFAPLPAVASAPASASFVAPAATPAPSDPAETERQRERDAVARLFKKNRDNLHVLTSH